MNFFLFTVLNTVLHLVSHSRFLFTPSLSFLAVRFATRDSTLGPTRLYGENRWSKCASWVVLWHFRWIHDFSLLYTSILASYSVLYASRITI